MGKGGIWFFKCGTEPAEDEEDDTLCPCINKSLFLKLYCSEDIGESFDFTEIKKSSNSG